MHGCLQAGHAPAIGFVSHTDSQIKLSCACIEEFRKLSAWPARGGGAVRCGLEKIGGR